MKDSDITLSEAAARIGCDRSTVSRKARTLKLGRKVGERVIVVTPAEFKKLQAAISPGQRGPKPAKKRSK